MKRCRSYWNSRDGVGVYVSQSALLAANQSTTTSTLNAMSIFYNQPSEFNFPIEFSVEKIPNKRISIPSTPKAMWVDFNNY